MVRDSGKKHQERGINDSKAKTRQRIVMTEGNIRGRMTAGAIRDRSVRTTGNIRERSVMIEEGKHQGQVFFFFFFLRSSAVCCLSKPCEQRK